MGTVITPRSADEKRNAQRLQHSSAVSQLVGGRASIVGSQILCSLPLCSVAAVSEWILTKGGLSRWGRTGFWWGLKPSSTKNSGVIRDDLSRVLGLMPSRLNTGSEGWWDTHSNQEGKSIFRSKQGWHPRMGRQPQGGLVACGGYAIWDYGGQSTSEVWVGAVLQLEAQVRAGKETTR